MSVAAPQNVSREYTCYKHSQFIQIGPGTCPRCGVTLEPRVPSADASVNAELADFQRRFFWTLPLTSIVLALDISDLLPGQPVQYALGRGLAWVELGFAAPVVLWAGWPLLVRGVTSLRGHLNMFALIALSVIAVFSYGLVVTLLPAEFLHTVGHGGGPAEYYAAASIIVSLVLLGQIWELRARQRAGDALRALHDLSPRFARRVGPDGHELDVPIAAVAAGDRLHVRPGERIAVDGVVITGASTIVESMVTGEPVPVEKHPGAAVIGGTLNGSGSFFMRVERVGIDTVLARIVQMVGEAQRSRAPIQGVVDLVTAMFVPIVAIVAIQTFVLWWLLGPEPSLTIALNNAVAVLIVACPCALGLAVPISIMVAMDRGVTGGVFIRSAEAIQVLSRADTLIFSKSGTLTEGKPKLVGIEPLAQFSGDELLRLAASLEQVNKHPLATAIVDAARARHLSLVAADGYEAHSGRGIAGRIDGRAVALGNAALLRVLRIDADAALARAEARRQKGETVIFVAVDGLIAGLIAVVDSIHDTAVQTLQQLQNEGLRLVLLTGDHYTTAGAVARTLGIEHVEADRLPEQKAETIRRLQAAGHRVAMVGDGINDAPALAEADVGIAIGGGADLIFDRVDVTLLRRDLAGVARVRMLSRRTVANIRQNLAFAVIYNLIGVSLAAGVLYPLWGVLLSPMSASAMMCLSAVMVITNALRLRRARL